MLEERVSFLNKITSKMSLSVKYFNGYTHIYYFGDLIAVGTTPECYNLLSIFMSGYYAGCRANNEMK